MATTAAGMKVELINPFVSSTSNVFKTMLSTDVHRGQIYLREKDNTHEGITGVIGLSGKAIGTAAVGLSFDTAMKACERFLGMEVDSVNEDVIDCCGELINMIAGGAKAKLEQYELSISLPSIVRGKDHTIDFPTNVTPICIPFSSDIGDILLQIGFEFFE